MQSFAAETACRDDWIQAATAPASIAIVGASDNPEKIGGRPIKYMLQQRYAGRLYPVNPGRPEVQGLQAWPSLADLPEVPEMMVVCVPGEACVAAVEEAACLGVKVAVVIASGFAETGDTGRLQQERMVTLARAGGMRIVGPNTQGLANFGTGTVASFASLIGEVPPADGPVAIVSQSGAMSMVPYAFLRAEGIGVRHSHATGNESDLSVADFALAVAEDPAVRLILLYMESVAQPETLARAARVARARGVPVLVLKAGVSARGQAAASSHTGAIATEDKTLHAWFARHGMTRVPDMRALVIAARLLLAAPAMPGTRVAAISNSGASCVMAADAAERHGLAMLPLSASTRERLAAVLPAFASTANPIDLTAALLGNGRLFSQALPILSEADEADAYFISLPMTGKGYDVAQFAIDTAAFGRATGRPVVVACPLPAARAAFEREGVATFAHDEDAMAALGLLARIHRVADEAARLDSVAALQQAPASLTTAAAGDRFMSEAASLRAVGAVGVRQAPWRLCSCDAELAAATAELPGPWVVKACSADIPHKSEHGLVRLKIATPAEVQAQAAEVRAGVARLGHRDEGVIVASMVRGRREFIVGARYDPVFGAVVIAGDGGAYAEALPDAATLVYPFDVQAARNALAGLRMAPLWPGVRGEPPLPLDGLATVAVALGAWVAAQRGAVASVDINPLIAADDGNLYAVDALVELGARP